MSLYNVVEQCGEQLLKGKCWTGVQSRTSLESLVLTESLDSLLGFLEIILAIRYSREYKLK